MRLCNPRSLNLEIVNLAILVLMTRRRTVIDGGAVMRWLLVHLILQPSIIAWQMTTHWSLIEEMKGRYTWNTSTMAGESARISYEVHDRHVSTIISVDRNACETRTFLKLTEGLHSVANDLIQRHYGPDELIVFMEGPTLQAKIGAYRGCNKYAVNFSVPVLPSGGGAYRLKVVHTRADYMAVDEVTTLQTAPVMQYYVMLDVAVDVAVSSINSTAVGAVAAVLDGDADTDGGGCESLWTAVYPNPILDAPEAMPSCTHKNTLDNECDGKLQLYSFINLTTVSWSEEGRNRCGACNGSMANNSLVCGDDKPERFDTYRWRSTCAVPPAAPAVPTTGPTVGPLPPPALSLLPADAFFTPQTAAALLTGRKLVFIGDSQMRTFARGLQSWACSEYACTGLSLDVIEEQFCNSTAWPRSPTVDVLALNCGHWPASHFHYSYDRYHHIVRTAVQALPALGYNATNFVWLESVVMPFRSDYFVRRTLDWRTPQRLDLFNKLAAKALRGSGIARIPMFYPSLALVDKFCDIAHYTALESMSYGYQAFLRILQRLLFKRQAGGMR